MVELTWFGHPGDTPVDIRACRFVIQWHEKSDLAEYERAHAIAHEWVVYCWEYPCRGMCAIQDGDILTSILRSMYQAWA